MAHGLPLCSLLVGNEKRDNGTSTYVYFWIPYRIKKKKKKKNIYNNNIEQNQVRSSAHDDLMIINPLLRHNLFIIFCKMINKCWLAFVPDKMPETMQH